MRRGDDWKSWHESSVKSTANCAILRLNAKSVFRKRVVPMSVKTVEEVSAEVPAEDFQALEEKVYRTIELYKTAKDARATAERDVKRLREQLEEREEQNEAMRRELVQLRKDREDIRGRVEKMLGQMDSLTHEQAAS
jgi:chromosome segregation ATPase